MCLGILHGVYVFIYNEYLFKNDDDDDAHSMIWHTAVPPTLLQAAIAKWKQKKNTKKKSH